MLKDSIFRIASMTKPITARALMILVDEGKVRLDDPVRKYIPEFGPFRIVKQNAETGELRRPPTLPLSAIFCVIPLVWAMTSATASLPRFIKRPIFSAKRIALCR